MREKENMTGWLIVLFYGVSNLFKSFWWKFVCFKVFISSNIYSWCTVIFRYSFVLYSLVLFILYGLGLEIFPYRPTAFRKVGWLFGSYDISTFVGHLTPNPFYTNNQFHFKQFSLAWVNSLVGKNISISSYSVYSNSSNSASISKCQNSSFLNNSG